MATVTARAPAGQADWSDPIILLRCKLKTAGGTRKYGSPSVGIPLRGNNAWMSAAYALHVNGVGEVREGLAVIDEALRLGHFCCLTFEPTGPRRRDGLARAGENVPRTARPGQDSPPLGVRWFSEGLGLTVSSLCPGATLALRVSGRRCRRL